jgi:hypothetical protein
VLLRYLAGLHVLGENRARGVGQHDLDLGCDAGEISRDTGERAAGADAADDGIEVVIHLLPDFWRRGLLVRAGIGRIAELVDVEGVGRLARETLRQVTIVFRMSLADIRAGQHHLGAHGPEVKDLLLAHLVGNDEEQPITFLRRHQREPEPGVARRCLDQRAAGRQPAVTLGRLDEIEPDAILDRAAGILILELEKKPARAGVEVRDGDHRRMADHLQDVAVGLRRHGFPCVYRLKAACGALSGQPPCCIGLAGQRRLGPAYWPACQLYASPRAARSYPAPAAGHCWMSATAGGDMGSSRRNGRISGKIGASASGSRSPLLAPFETPYRHR